VGLPKLHDIMMSLATAVLEVMRKGRDVHRSWQPVNHGPSASCTINSSLSVLGLAGMGLVSTRSWVGWHEPANQTGHSILCNFTLSISVWELAGARWFATQEQAEHRAV